MKKILTVTGVVALTLLIAFGTTQMIFAKGGMGNRNGGSGNRSGINNQPVSFVDKLKLNDDQIAKINALIKNDNTSSKTLQDKIRTNRTFPN